jgi:MYXO-CTERM domain-containing protein
VGTELRFDGTGSSDADGTLSAYAWDFGDGSTASGVTAAHTYASAGTYLVRLTVTDDQGAFAQDAALVTVGGQANRAPVADAGSHRSVELNAPVAFDASGSFDADGALAAYAWDFGDGATATGAQAQHAYTRPGSYLVALTVTDAQGATAQDYVLVLVAEPILANAPPLAEAGQDVSGHAGQPLTFSASGSADVDGALIGYTWDFGDGTTASGLSASHAYQGGGTYTVTLTVIDNVGARHSDTLVARVNALPTAQAGAARSGDVGTELAFDASASADPDGTVASYAWDFGDGSRAEGVRVAHAWQEPGMYTVRLTVTDNAGASSRAEALVVINRPPVVQPPPADTGCAAAPGSGSSLGFLAMALLLAVALRRRHG